MQLKVFNFYESLLLHFFIGSCPVFYSVCDIDVQFLYRRFEGRPGSLRVSDFPYLAIMIHRVYMISPCSFPILVSLLFSCDVDAQLSYQCFGDHSGGLGVSDFPF